MTAQPYDVILFDLGGVLIELAGVPTMLAWTRGRFTEEQLWDRWLSSRAVREFESGQSTPEVFGEAVVAEFQLPVSIATFLEAFRFWPRRLYPGTRALLRTLAEQYTLASLSNISAMHWERICHEMALAPCFEHNFPSFETGFVKPDKEAFMHAIESLGCPPQRVLFMDDNAANVETARSLGMAAFTVAGLDGVKAVLEAAAVY